MKFKKPLTIDEQIDYLKNNKMVKYDEINMEEAKKILYLHNYINVINPYKYYFCEKSKFGIPLKNSQGKYVYNKETEFSEYYKRYAEERSHYPLIYHSLLEFETSFNSVLSLETILYYDIENSNKFKRFIEKLLENLNMKQLKKNVKSNMENSIRRFEDELEKYENIYVFFDRLSLNESITIFMCCDEILMKKIFGVLLENFATLNYEDLPTFLSILPIIVKIRNCICHGNSLEIMCRY